MKKIIITFIISMTLLSASLFSQQTDSLRNQPEILKKNKWAVQFGVGYDFQIGSFKGLMFSLKYNLSKYSALRFGADYTGRGDKEKYEEDDLFTKNSYDLSEDYHQATIECSYIFYTNSSSRFNLYWGIGPAGRFGYIYDEGQDYQINKYIRTHERISWAAGLNALLGVEWFPISDISLFAEYEVTGLYGRTYDTHYLLNEKRLYVEKYKENSEYWSFDGNNARLGISVYFDKLF